MNNGTCIRQTDKRPLTNWAQVTTPDGLVFAISWSNTRTSPPSGRELPLWPPPSAADVSSSHRRQNQHWTDCSSIRWNETSGVVWRRPATECKPVHGAEFPGKLRVCGYSSQQEVPHNEKKSFLTPEHEVCGGRVAHIEHLIIEFVWGKTDLHRTPDYWVCRGKTYIERLNTEFVQWRLTIEQDHITVHQMALHDIT